MFRLNITPTPYRGDRIKIYRLIFIKYFQGLAKQGKLQYILYIISNRKKKKLLDPKTRGDL
jgi:hypothetical protein